MFATRLKELRKIKGISQIALAQQLGLTQQAVGKWETGRSSPDPATVAALASYFNVSSDYLLGCETNRAIVPQHIGRNECMVPVIGTVRAGFGALAFEEDYGEEPANVKNPACAPSAYLRKRRSWCNGLR